MNPEEQFTEDIRVRVPKVIREAFKRLGKKHYKKEAELVREALIDYLAKQGESITESTSAAGVPTSGPYRAIHAAQGSGKKQKAALPSGNKPSRAASGQ